MFSPFAPVKSKNPSIWLGRDFFNESNELQHSKLQKLIAEQKKADALFLDYKLALSNGETAGLVKQFVANVKAKIAVIIVNPVAQSKSEEAVKDLVNTIKKNDYIGHFNVAHTEKNEEMLKLVDMLSSKTKMVTDLCFTHLLYEICGKEFSQEEFDSNVNMSGGFSFGGNPKETLESQILMVTSYLVKDHPQQPTFTTDNDGESKDVQPLGDQGVVEKADHLTDA